MKQSNQDTERYKRRSELDRRIDRGDDFAGDAWEDTDQTVNGGSWCAVKIMYTVVGHNPNANETNTREINQC